MNGASCVRFGAKTNNDMKVKHMRKNEFYRFLTPTKGHDDISAKSVRELTPAGLNDEDARIADHVALSLDACDELPFEWGPQEQHFISQCEPARIVPYLVYRYKMSIYPQQKIVSDFPVYLLIEPASACNLRCVMCFQVDAQFNKKSSGYMGYMDYDLYTRLIDEAAAGGTRAVTLASRGEPLLHPRIGDMLAYAASKDAFFDIKLNTNGTRLTSDVAHAILKANVSIVVISIDSADAEQYAKIRVRGDFETVLNNVKEFMRIKKEHYPNSRTEVRVAGVRLKNPALLTTEQDEKAFFELWSGIVDTVAMTDAEERWDTYNNTQHPEMTKPCAYLFERMYIWWDGVMNPCDVDYRSRLTTGNATTMSIKDAWHGGMYRRLREAHLRGTRANFNPCDRCGVS